MNVTDKAVSKWEGDLSCPDIHSIPKLAEVLGTTVDILMRVKSTARTEPEKNSAGIIRLALRDVTSAMGISVTVLPILKKTDIHSAVTMPGIGLTCAGISLLQKEVDKDE